MNAVLTKLVTFTNTINSQPFLGGVARTWKCQGGRWSKKVEQDSTTGGRNAYIEVSWEFSYQRDTWQFHERDHGYMDKNGKTITGADGKAVKEPWPLQSGLKAPAGTVPSVLSFDVYEEKDLAAEFGTIT